MPQSSEWRQVKLRLTLLYDPMIPTGVSTGAARTVGTIQPVAESTSPSSGVALAELREVGVRRGVAEEIRGVWQRREFIGEMAFDGLRAANMNTLLGNFWHVLNPVLSIFVYWLIFDQVLDVSRGVDNFITFLAAGIFFYQLTVRSITAGGRSILSNGGLLRAIWFPRIVLPVTTIVQETIAHLAAFVVMLAVLLAGGEDPALRWLLVVPFLVVQLAFNLGGALITARLSNRFADIQNFLPFFFQLVFYSSGILFLFENRIESETAQRIVDFNPIYGMVTTYRWMLLDMSFNQAAFWSFCGWAVALLLLGFMIFRRGESEYGRQ